MTQLLNAFSPGADLWVIPDIEANWWSQHIDWKLNFQIAKNLSRKSSTISPDLEKILNECGIKINNNSLPNANLLIESNRVLPNRWVLMLDCDWSNNDSVKQLANHWKSLKKPSTRIFLPKEINKKHALLIWQKVCGEISAEIDFVEDPKHV